MVQPTVLVAGAGIAGATVCYWLARAGFQTTLVERAPSPRLGGYMIDLTDPGFEVVTRMGIADELRAKSHLIEEVRTVDRDGRVVGKVSGSLLREGTGDRFLSILRGQLADTILSTVAQTTEARFGDSIKSMVPDDIGVSVTFEGGSSARYDLVIGADGLHSATRGRVMGRGINAQRQLGYMAAAFSADGYSSRDTGCYVGFLGKGRQVWRFSLPGDRTVFSFLFSSDPRVGPPSVVGAQKQAIRDAFCGTGWESHEILSALDRSNDLYFDSVTQIELRRWSAGRVALVGDACFAPSLISGSGSSFALAGAYILAGELGCAKGDYREAFRRYEARFRPFVSNRQRAARRAAILYAPTTTLGMWLRRVGLHLLSAPFVGPRLLRSGLTPPFDLPTYGWAPPMERAHA